MTILFKKVLSKSFLVLLFVGEIGFAQENDSITISKEMLRKMIQEEVQKELHRIQENKIEAIPTPTIETAKTTENSESKKLIGERIKFSGTGLLRLGEWDFKQNDINPTTGEVKDLHKRFWTRMNFYLNIDSKLTESLDFHARIRTGQKQYSFVTFGENVDERFNIIMDQFWLNYKLKNYEFRIGRQDAGRIWSNQKGAMFDIPQHDGATIAAIYNVGDVNISPKVAYFVENYQNNSAYKNQGKMYGASVQANQTKENISWKLETGLIKAEKLPTRYKNDIADNSKGTKYHDGDLAPDYAIWTNQAKLAFPRLKNLTFMVDYYHNFKKYSKNPVSHLIHDANGKNAFSNPEVYDNATAPDFTKQNQGFIASVSVGNLGIPKNLWASVSYLYMEKYATMDYFAQYDYTRWASSNIKGPEFSLGYRFNKYLQMRARYFISNEIKGYYSTNPAYKKSEDRIRIDFNINF
jgi:hypothetical protein